MSVLDDVLAKAKGIADKNGDGKIDAADLEALKDGLDQEGKAKLSEAQKLADKNGDGKIDFSDLQSLAGDAGNIVNDVKSKLFGKK